MFEIQNRREDLSQLPRDVQNIINILKSKFRSEYDILMLKPLIRKIDFFKQYDIQEDYLLRQ